MKKIILLLLFSNLFFAQELIFIDENINDWNNVESYSVDAAGDNLSSEFDFRTFWVTNDKEYLYFRIQTTDHITLVNKNFLTMYIDADNDSNTGRSISGLGAELEYTLGLRSGKIYSSGERTIYNRDIGFIGSPTFSSNEFEFAIKIDSTNEFLSLSPNDTIKISFIAYMSSEFTNHFDLTPDVGGFEYKLKDSEIKTFPISSIEKQSNNHFRIMSYNVARDGITSVEKTTEFTHIFKTIKPDIIGFTEIYESSSQQVADRLEFFLPSNTDQTWYNKKEGEYDIVLVSRFKIKKSITINSEVGHDASGAFILDLRPAYDSDMLVVVSHPKCCSGNIEDEKRQNQIDAIIAFVRNSVNNVGELTILPNTPIVIMGDMNLVGDSRQYETLLSGDIEYNETYGDDFIPDWDKTEFDDAIPYVTNTGMTYTTNPGSFPPGRLDFIVFSGSVMKEENSFIFDTNKLTSEQLLKYGLNAKDTEVSDHLPVVVDFNITPLTTVKKKIK
jgi:endonuclease/exonuclease/phosphatase family metal-dependent hydrolase